MSATDTKTPWFRDGLAFECTRCGACCTGAPGYVWVNAEEIARLAEFRGESLERFSQQFVRRVGDDYSLIEKPGGDCIFWDKQAGCTVYDARPVQCRTWPFWPENIAQPEAWEHVRQVCPGSGQGRLYTIEEIRAAAEKVHTMIPDVAPAELDPDQFRRALRALYDALDAEVAGLGPVCQVSGRCCRFAAYGHTLFVSAPEFHLLLTDAPAPSRPLDDGVTCPWQDALGRCTARDARPLGCRVYFCDPAFEPHAPALSETFLARLKRLTEELDLPWNYAPLHHHLRQAEAAGRFPPPLHPVRS